MLDQAAIRAAAFAAMDEIKDPCSLAAGTPFGLTEMGLVKSIDVTPEGHVALHLRLTSPFCHMIGFFKSDAIRRVSAIPGVVEVTVDADNGLDWSPSEMSPSAQQRRTAQLRSMERRARA